MGNKLTDTQVVTTTGVKNPATLLKFPEYGGTFTASIDAGSAVVQVRGWVTSGAKEVLATFTLPVPSGTKAGDLFDSIPIFSTWDDWDWNVMSISGANLTLACAGVGV